MTSRRSSPAENVSCGDTTSCIDVISDTLYKTGYFHKFQRKIDKMLDNRYDLRKDQRENWQIIDNTDINVIEIDFNKNVNLDYMW